jgi:hypothetical protein
MSSGVAVGDASQRIDAAWRAFITGYATHGGHRFYGWDHAAESRNYYGPRFWSEADCAWRFALELERQFPEQVHMEVPVASWTFADFDRVVDGRQFVDIVVSDLSDFVEDEASQQRFRSLVHTLFVEVKFFPAGCSRTWRHDHVRKVPAVHRDAERLARHLARGHCERAAILVVDDDCLFEDERAGYTWPSEVIQLIASPRRLTG